MSGEPGRLHLVKVDLVELYHARGLPSIHDLLDQKAGYELDPAVF